MEKKYGKSKFILIARENKKRCIIQISKDDYCVQNFL